MLNKLISRTMTTIIKSFAIILIALATLQSNPILAAPNPLGTNISSPDGTVYTITQENGNTVRRPYTSAGAYLSYGFNSWGNVLPANQDDLALPVGSFIPPRDGSIVCSDRGTDKGTCYLITESKRAGFTSEAVFRGLGFDFKNALAGDVSFLNTSPHIDNSSQAHRAGTLVNKDGTVYFVSPTGLLGIPDWIALLSWGYSQADIVPANTADRGASIAGILTSRQAGQISPRDLISTTPPTETPPTAEPPHSETPYFITEAMTDGNSIQDYSFQFKAAGGLAPYTFTLGANSTISYCCNLKMDKYTGVLSNHISGQKPQKGTWDVEIRVTDDNGTTVRKTYQWRVIDDPRNLDITHEFGSVTISQATARLRFRFYDGSTLKRVQIYINGQYYTTDNDGYIIITKPPGTVLNIKYGSTTKNITLPTYNPQAPTTPIIFEPSPCSGTGPYVVCA